MARTPSIGELLLGGVIVALVGFVGSQVLASPRRTIRESRSLTARDSAAIVAQYDSQIASRGDQYVAPEWLSQVQVARLEAAAERDVRAAQVTSTSGNAPLCGWVVPEPSVRLPCQVVVALLSVAIQAT